MHPDYPSRAVSIVVPITTGGPADNYARFVAQRVQDVFKHIFIVDDKPGAGSGALGVPAMLVSGTPSRSTCGRKRLNMAFEKPIPTPPRYLHRSSIPATVRAIS